MKQQQEVLFLLYKNIKNNGKSAASCPSLHQNVVPVSYFLTLTFYLCIYSARLFILIAAQYCTPPADETMKLKNVSLW